MYLRFATHGWQIVTGDCWTRAEKICAMICVKQCNFKRYRSIKRFGAIWCNLVQNGGITFACIENVAMVPRAHLDVILAHMNEFVECGLRLFNIIYCIAHILVASFIAACRLILLTEQIATPENDRDWYFFFYQNTMKQLELITSII